MSKFKSTRFFKNDKARFTTRMVAYTGIMTAMVMVATLLGFSTAQFYFNVGDTVILICSAIFGPIPAMIAGGLGAFFADMAVYPATMVFTLCIKAVEGFVAGCLFKIIYKFIKNKPLKIILSIIAMAFSSALMMTGYFLCQTLFYGTYAAAIIALPMDAVQAVVSTTLASILLYLCHLIEFKERFKLPIKSKKSKTDNIVSDNVIENDTTKIIENNENSKNQ